MAHKVAAASNRDLERRCLFPHSPIVRQVLVDTKLPQRSIRDLGMEPSAIWIADSVESSLVLSRVPYRSPPPDAQPHSSARMSAGIVIMWMEEDVLSTPAVSQVGVTSFRRKPPLRRKSPLKSTRRCRGMRLPSATPVTHEKAGCDATGFFVCALPGACGQSVHHHQLAHHAA